MKNVESLGKARNVSELIELLQRFDKKRVQYTLDAESNPVVEVFLAEETLSDGSKVTDCMLVFQREQPSLSQHPISVKAKNGIV